jgi:hypothetical protein
MAATAVGSSSGAGDGGGAKGDRKRSLSTSEDGRRASGKDDGGQPARRILLRTGGGGGKRPRRSSVERPAEGTLAQAIDDNDDNKDDEGGTDVRYARTKLAYAPYVHVEYYIQPAERYPDRAVLVQEASRRVPEILAAERRRLAAEQQQQRQAVAGSSAATAGAVIDGQPALPSVASPGSVPPMTTVPSTAPLKSADVSSQSLSPPTGRAIGPPLPSPSDSPAGLRPPPTSLPTSPPPLLPFHDANVPTPTTAAAPARRARAGKPKAASGHPAPVLRAARHFLPWGVPPPRMLEFKSDFALDGECVIAACLPPLPTTLSLLPLAATDR